MRDEAWMMSKARAVASSAPAFSLGQTVSVPLIVRENLSGPKLNLTAEASTNTERTLHGQRHGPPRRSQSVYRQPSLTLWLRDERLSVSAMRVRVCHCRRCTQGREGAAKSP